MLKKTGVADAHKNTTDIHYNNNNTPDNIYSAVIMTTRSL